MAYVLINVEQITHAVYKKRNDTEQYDLYFPGQPKFLSVVLEPNLKPTDEGVYSTGEHEIYVSKKEFDMLTETLQRSSLNAYGMAEGK
jgi:hypothetical protein